jgi:3-oxoacyl-[acyl-carrier-protein] synthase II
MSERRRVVITGAGMVTPVGEDAPSTWEALLAGRSGVGRIRRFDASTLPVDFAAEICWLSGPDQGAMKLTLVERALAEALAGAGALPYPGERVGVCMGSEAARPDLGVLARRVRTREMPDRAEVWRATPRAPTERVAELVGARGPTSTVSTACTSSSQAIGEGVLRIRRGEADAMIVGGVDVLVDPVMVTGFSLLGALSTSGERPEAASRPFDRGRDGFVLGEGAGVLVLEDAELALRRGATPLAEIRGWGCSCNAYRITDSPPDGRGAAQAMSAALLDAGVDPSEVGYINAHGTSTQMNDSSETRGIYTALGEAAAEVAVSSTKSMTGHLVAACGAVEAIITALAIREGVLPPTINLESPDPECQLNHVANRARRQQVEHALTNAFGFGGSNGSLLISRWRRG